MLLVYDECWSFFSMFRWLVVTVNTVYFGCVSDLGFAQFTAADRREYIWFWCSGWAFIWLVYWAAGLHKPVRI